MKINIHEGTAHTSGFELMDDKIRVQSKNYDEKNSFGKSFEKKFGFVFYLLVIFSFFAHGVLFWGKINIFRFFFAIVFLFIFNAFIFVLFIAFLDKEYRRWHACEHKIANLLNRGLELTLENLRNISQLHSKCSSQLGFPIILALAGEYLILTLTKINILSSLLYVLCLILFLYLFIAYLLSAGLPFQYLLTKKPTEEQFQEALRVAKEFKSKKEVL